MINFVATIRKDLPKPELPKAMNGNIHVTASKPGKSDRALRSTRIDLLTVILSMYLGVIVLVLAMGVFWILSHFVSQ